MHILECKSYNVVPLVYYFHVRVKMLSDFQICISVLLIKKTPAQVFSNEFSEIFQKTLQNSPDDCSSWFLHLNQGFIHWSHFVFPFVIENCSYGSLLRKGIRMKIYFLHQFIQKLTWVLLRQYARHKSANAY